MLRQDERAADSMSNEKISIRAYQLWQDRGCPECDGSEDWQVAQQQLAVEAEQTSRRRPLRRLWDRLRIRAA